MVSIIVAISENYAIGKNNGLLCHMSADLKRFKALTTGHTIIMGRRTYESLPNGALPNRRNIVISNTLKLEENDNLRVVPSYEKAIELCQDEDEVFVIGGAQIYRYAFDWVDKLEVTWIHESFEDADVFFPNIEAYEWQEVNREFHTADEKNPYDYSFVTYCRKNN